MTGATAESKQLANAWTSDDAVDDTRRKKAQSINELASELEKTRPDAVKQYAKPLPKVGG